MAHSKCSPRSAVYSTTAVCRGIIVVMYQMTETWKARLSFLLRYCCSSTFPITTTDYVVLVWLSKYSLPSWSRPSRSTGTLYHLCTASATSREIPDVKYDLCLHHYSFLQLLQSKCCLFLTTEDSCTYYY